MRGRVVLVVATTVASALVLGVVTPASGTTPTITTFVGLQGTGDGSLATAVVLGQPQRIAVEALPTASCSDGGAAAANIYFSERTSHRVRQIKVASGVITTVAGTGYPGLSGDNAHSSAAQLKNPGGIAVDTAGNIYIADTGNHRIRKVAAVSGTITTVAGSTQGYSGDLSGQDATSAQLNAPEGVAVDNAGNLYIADTNNNRIHQVRLSTGKIYTIAGSGIGQGFSGDGGSATAAQMAAPRDVDVYTPSVGNRQIFVADSVNNRVRMFELDSSNSPLNINTVAGSGLTGTTGDGGLATSAQLNIPHSIAVDCFGGVYVSDTYSNRIRWFTVGGPIGGYAGTGSYGFGGDGSDPITAMLAQAQGLTVDRAGNLYIADTFNDRIRKITVTGTPIITTIGGRAEFSGDGGPATSATINGSRGIVADSAGNIYFSDSMNHRIRRVSTAGVITTVAGTGSTGANNGAALSATFNKPQGLAIEPSGNLLIADVYNNLIRRLNVTAGTVETVAGGGLGGGASGDGGPPLSASLWEPSDVDVDGAGNIYIADTRNDRIRKITIASNQIDTVPGTAGVLSSPGGLDVDSAGNIYIADTRNNRVRRVTAAGTMSTIVGDGSLSSTGDGGPASAATTYEPQDVVLDQSGNLYFSDSDYRVRRVDGITGNIAAFAGTGAAGYAGDGGAPTSALMGTPTALAFDPAGSLYISDPTNKRIRKVTFPVTATPTTAPSPATTVAPLVVPRRGGLTARRLALYAGMTIPSRASISLSVARASRRTCTVRRGRLLSLRTGTCRFTITVKPRTGPSLKRTLTLPSA